MKLTNEMIDNGVDLTEVNYERLDALKRHISAAMGEKLRFPYKERLKRKSTVCKHGIGNKTTF